MLIRKSIFKGRSKQVTQAEIRAIVGPLDDIIIEAILHTGATSDEIRQAFVQLEEDTYTKAIFTRRMDERVRSVYDLLDYERNFFNGQSYGR